jgi:ubiquinone/menaquinone biosynthesis C-methylase UbiE
MSALEESKVRNPLSWGPTDGDYAGDGKLPFRDADAYEARPPYPEELIKCVVARCEPFGDDLKLVDIGCGNGRGTCPLSRALKQNSRILRKTVYGVDCDSGMLEKAKETGPDIHWILSKVKDLSSVIPEKVQVVTVFTALHYCDSFEDIEAISKVLTTGGIVVEIEGGGPLNCRRMQDLMGEHVEGSDGRHGGGREGVREHMQRGGFQVVDQKGFTTMVTHTAKTAWADIESSLSIQTDEKKRKKSEEVWKRCFDKEHPTREVPKSFSVVVYKKA